MKKLTLLVAGLAMGLASAFAFTPSGTALTGTEGTATTRTGWQTEFSFGNAVAAEWGQYRIDVAGWDAEYNVLAITVADASDFRYSIHNDPADLGAVTGEYWLDQTNGKKAPLVDEQSVVTADGKTTFYINFAKANVTACVGINIMTNNGGTIYSVNWFKGGEQDSSEEPIWVSALDPDVKVFASQAADGYNISDEEMAEHPEYLDLYDHTFYWYDSYAKAWIYDYPAINQNFTFAVEASEGLKKFCDYKINDDVYATLAAHYWSFTDPDNHNVDFRFDRIPGTYVYAVDLNAAQMKDYKNESLNWEGPNADVHYNKMWFKVVIAFMGNPVDEGENACWTDLTGTLEIRYAEALPTAQSVAFDNDWAMAHAAKDENTACITDGVAPFGTSTGIADVIADSIESGKAIKAIIDGNVVIVKGDEVFSILGAKIK